MGATPPIDARSMPRSRRRSRCRRPANMTVTLDAGNEANPLHGPRRIKIDDGFTIGMENRKHSQFQIVLSKPPFAIVRVGLLRSSHQCRKFQMQLIRVTAYTWDTRRYRKPSCRRLEVRLWP